MLSHPIRKNKNAERMGTRRGFVLSQVPKSKGGTWGTRQGVIRSSFDDADETYEPIWNVPADWTLSDEFPTYTVYVPGAITHVLVEVSQ